ncbi:TonB family protein [Sphingomicrobium lutaoense]|uniref:Protein TonB n=2 Tax=Sphingomicrobium lutaoense TaxID=515949 RepID=A0A839Z0H3_9SPHN|nr:TonB family protein [Sphingomicrobium lutaoense]MBB3763143.1 protein TonB [Sphingomicrobium lutaoense]
MAYRDTIEGRTRIGTLALVILLHAAALAAALLIRGEVVAAPFDDEPLETFDVAIVEPPMAVVEESEDASVSLPRDEGMASAENIESEAKPVEAPKPKVKLPPVNPRPAAEDAGAGNDATQGASTNVGPGAGAGGVGPGTGAGEAGTGKGGGGINPPVLIAGNITRKDYPKELRDQPLVRGEMILEFTIGVDGRVRYCRAVKSSGNAILDRDTCRLMEERYRYRPATNGRGEPISIVGRARRVWFEER